MVRRRIVVGRNSIDIIDFGLGKSSIFPLPRLPAFFRSQGSFPIVNVNEPINEEREEGGERGVIGGRRSPQLARISAGRRRVGNLVQFISRLCSIIVGMTIIWSRSEWGARACSKPAESAGGINRMNSNCAARRSIANLSLSLSALLALFQLQRRN